MMTMRKTTMIAAMAAAALALAGCNSTGPKQTIGGLGGAVAGGLIGSQFGAGDGQLLAVGIGTLAGALIGSEIGASLDRADQAYAAQAYQQAFESYPTGQTVQWSNPQTGNYGTVTPTRTYSAGGRDCREFTQTIYVQGTAQTGTGTACRNANGTWSIV